MSKSTDFNDLAQLAGAGAVKAAVDKVLAAAAAPAVVQTPASEWPAPHLPGMVKAPEIPATILPGWLGAMAGAVSDSTQTPPALAVMVGLSVLAAVLQRRFEVAPFSDDGVGALLTNSYITNA
ncbi:YfjI family protein [Thauera aromatica]|nr:YfjI family protein [Thauera aromatica]MCK2128225.1 YfjI family protein [Thauera aromatica]